MTQDTRNEHAVISAVESMTHAFHHSDLQAVLDHYEANASVAFQPGMAAIGHEAIADGFRMAFEMKPTFTYGGHEVTVSGDIALHIAPWNMTATAPDGKAIHDQGLSVAVLRRAPSGAWKLLVDNPHGEQLMAKHQI